MVNAISNQKTDAIREVISFLHRRALCLAGSSSDAWDLVQDALERALHRWPTSWNDTELRRWLAVVLRHLNIDRVRSSERRASRTSTPNAADLLVAPEVSGISLWRTADPDRIEGAL